MTALIKLRRRLVKKAILIPLMLFLTTGLMLTGEILPAGHAASSSDIETAIAKGLAYLNRTQSPTGQWAGSSPNKFFPVASTAMAVLAFETNGHYGWNKTDPYSNNVQKGLDWLFSVSQIVELEVQSPGNPDSNGNGIGLFWGSNSEPLFQTPMALMAIVASQTPTNVTNIGQLGTRTYNDIAVDTVDYLVWAQNDRNNKLRGGWGHFPNDDDSDSSISNWVIMGLMAAESWNIDAPAFVKTELNIWVETCQYLTGDPTTHYYYGSFLLQPGDPLRDLTDAAAGILELTYLGALTSDARIIAAQGYINRIWTVNDGNWNVNIGSLYNMYTLMRACRDAKPLPITYIAKYTGAPGVEWYNGTGQYADALIFHQNYDGSWYDWEEWEMKNYFPKDLATALAILILKPAPDEVRITYSLTVNVKDALTLTPIGNATVSVVGPATFSGLTGNDGKSTFSIVQLGSYQVNASAQNYFPSTIQTLHVTSNDSITLLLSRLSSPYIFSRFTFSPSNPNVNGSILFDGSSSNSSSPIASYFWNFGDDTTVSDLVTTAHAYSSVGNYTVTLTVASADGTDTWSQVVTVSESQGDVFPWWWLLVLALLILLLLLLLLLLRRRRHGVIVIQTRELPVRCLKCIGDGNCDNCDLTPC